ncbi:pantoate--beta-alanine ligase [Sporomusa sp.]|uniref:pantoate--beta-alanine ligase n=1 Tax=Sporomusa sp. TaxID=2078658 RepID=UPI002B857306|nr:pantoate--beta-alanine ligase [Sporomusa sp.]HWR06065.1 pantoate--beta-alanine ligase [Sporomusa sp.]
MARIVESVTAMRALVTEARKKGKSIGFVPTMGALHAGHLELMKEAKKLCDVVVVSIFVNPTQFGPNEDFDAYPRTWDEDLAACRSVGVDAVFHPPARELYPDGWGTWVDVGGVTDKLCGKSRPTHFRGVATVVTKLFNIVQPDKAFFGQKDAQQVIVLKKMVRDLDMFNEIVMVPIVREADGLAKSSRNAYLSQEQRQAALVLNQSLSTAFDMAASGERDITAIKAAVLRHIQSVSLANVDYVEIYSFPDLAEIDILDQDALLAVAVKFGSTRLIDNIILTPKRT